MARKAIGGLAVLVLLGAACAAQQAYPGFDRDVYPGDAALPALRKDFRYTGYWLNDPPGETRNSWAGKLPILQHYGFGFLVLFNGRSDAQLRGRDGAALGAEDGKAAAADAAREGFPRNVRIFLDQEEGGRLLPEQAAYLFGWIDAVRAAGARAGVYCSGIGVPDGAGGRISTAQDIVARERERVESESKGKSPEGRRPVLALWIANDQCPPSPGCTLASSATAEAFSPDVRPSAIAWQYAQSPRRTRFSAGCPANQAPDGNCYAPGLPPDANTFVDLDTANSPDPSEAP